MKVPDQITLRAEVQLFAAAMERELRANDYKGGWTHMTMRRLMTRLRQEVEELENADGTESVMREAADVANFAMMIADVCGGLREDG